MSNKIIRLTTHDVRFPTADHLVGSDAINKDPDYSAAYVVLETERGNHGYGLVFTIGRGNDLCCRAIESMEHLVLGHELAEIKDDIAGFYEHLRSDSQLRWLGPETGIIHMAAGALANAVWDMWARDERKPLWRLLADMPPEQFVECIDFRYITDVISRDEVLEMIRNNAETKSDRIRRIEQRGYPAYTTSAGWLGYEDDKLRRLCREALDNGFRHIKLKVGQDLADDVRRCSIAREAIGPDAKLIVDANQAWEVDQAVEWLKHLAPMKPWFIEEPTSPDDILGHQAIRQRINGIQVGTGEHCQNRVIFKQLITSDAIDIVQIDACRLAGLNEVLSVYAMAAKFGKLVCPHAGGVGLCEYVQHLSMIDYVQLSADIGERVIEYVDHLHEHFEDPCRVEDGAYLAPTQPGFGVKMLADSVDRYRYPSGEVWQARRPA